MKKGVQLMTQIAKLARQAVVELDNEDDKQAAVEIRLAAECVIGANQKGGARVRASLHEAFHSRE